MPLLIHGEVTNNEIDIFDREKVFIEQHLDFIIGELPNLKITLEHTTTEDAVSYIMESEFKSCGINYSPSPCFK